MKKLFLPLMLLVGCYVLLFAYVDFSYGSLPKLVAAHFDASGRPNGWMSRDGVVYFTVGFAIFLPAIIISLMAFASRLPVRLVNIPHREYWLAPERRVETDGILLRFAIWLAALIVLFMAWMHWLIVEANTVGGNQLNQVGVTMVAGVFLVGTVGWSIVLIRRFLRPEANE